MAIASLLGAGTSTMVNVALPAIGDDLHASFSGLQWIVNAFTVVTASCMLPATSLGTNLGRRRMFVAGMLMVSIGSGASALAPNLAVLIAGRVFQALGAAVAGPTALGILIHQYVHARERRHAIGLWAAGASVGLAMGPLVAGALIDSVDWRGVFALTSAAAFVVSVVAWTALTEATHGRRTVRVGIDFPGSALAGITLAALSYSFIEANDYGWGSPRIVAAFALTGFCGVVLVCLDLRREIMGKPVVISRTLWGRRSYVAANAGGALFFFALYGNLFLFSVYCEHHLGFSALRTGLVFLPMTALMAVLAVGTGRVVARLGPRTPTVAGFVIATVGDATLIDVGSSPSASSLAIRFAVMGLGFGLISAPLTDVAMADLPDSIREPAASTYNAVRQVGSVVSVAVLGAIAPIGVDGLATRFIAATAVTTGLLVVAAAVVLVLLRARPRRHL